MRRGQIRYLDYDTEDALLLKMERLYSKADIATAIRWIEDGRYRAAIYIRKMPPAGFPRPVQTYFDNFRAKVRPKIVAGTCFKNV